METKLIAAEIATAAGVSTIITSSRTPASLFSILEYHGATSSSGSSGTTRPLHTLFTPSAMPLRDLKAWTRHTLTPAGAVIIDPGAHSVLARRESGGRLLAAGVLGVRGAFASGQAVRILVRKNAAGAISDDIEAAREEYVRGLAPTQPGTPLATDTVGDGSSMCQDLGSDGTEGVLPLLPVQVGDAALVEKGIVEWEVEEVGRGLANYNSAQVDQVKGLNRCVSLVGSLRFPSLIMRVSAPTCRSCWDMQIRNTLLRM
jgi:glutamate 5-kinase